MSKATENLMINIIRTISWSTPYVPSLVH